MKKYFDIDNSSIVSRARAYFHFRGKNIHVKQDWDRSVLKIEKNLKSAIEFIFNQFEKKSKPNQDQWKKINNTNPITPEDRDEYIPQDMKDCEDPNRPPSFWQVNPPLPGYYYSGKKSYYDISTKLWSKKKVLEPYEFIDIDTTHAKHTFSGKIAKWVFSLPLPTGILIDIASIHPTSPHIHIQKDQKWCFYVISTGSHEVKFDFYLDQRITEASYIPADSEKIITGALTGETQKLLQTLQNSSQSIEEKTRTLCNHIALFKKYSVEYQFYIYHKSIWQDYFYNLDESPLLECYSANTLYVALVRELGIPARLCSWHRLESSDEYGGNSHISNKTGHAWSEIWNGSEWILMDATPVQKDKNLVDDLKEDINREEENRKNEMSDMWFDSSSEKWLYDIYKSLEEEVRPMIAKNIRDLENILPREYILEEEWYFRSGKLDKRKLVQWKISGDSKIFTRNSQVDLDPELLLFEGILIDNSGSMGDVNVTWSPLREAVKSAIVRARTLEHFDVHFSIMVFNTEAHEVMKFGEKYTSKKNIIPSRLMRAVHDRWWTDISKPLEHMESLIQGYQSGWWNWRYGNITFIGDGEPTHGKTGKDLKKLIERIWTRYPITAYYISWWSQSSWALGSYFWEDNVEVIQNVDELSSAMMRTFNRKLKNRLTQMTSYNS